MTKQSAVFAVPNRILASTDAMIWTAMNMRRSAKIMLRRAEHDYILVRAYTWNRSRSGWYYMYSDHVR